MSFNLLLAPRAKPLFDLIGRNWSDKIWLNFFDLWNWSCLKSDFGSVVIISSSCLGPDLWPDLVPWPETEPWSHAWLIIMIYCLAAFLGRSQEWEKMFREKEAQRRAASVRMILPQENPLLQESPPRIFVRFSFAQPSERVCCSSTK